MKYILIVSLIFIVGCGATLTLKEYKERRPENFKHIDAACTNQNVVPRKVCIKREEAKVYNHYVHTPSFPQRYMNAKSNRPLNSNTSNGKTVYRADECIGSIVNGVCHGTILPKQAVHKKCHGQMLNGKCTGPMF